MFVVRLYDLDLIGLISTEVTRVYVMAMHVLIPQIDLVGAVHRLIL